MPVRFYLCSLLKWRVGLWLDNVDCMLYDHRRTFVTAAFDLRDHTIILVTEHQLVRAVQRVLTRVLTVKFDPILASIIGGSLHFMSLAGTV